MRTQSWRKKNEVGREAYKKKMHSIITPKHHIFSWFIPISALDYVSNPSGVFGAAQSLLHSIPKARSIIVKGYEKDALAWRFVRVTMISHTSLGNRRKLPLISIIFTNFWKRQLFMCNGQFSYSRATYFHHIHIYSIIIQFLLFNCVHYLAIYMLELYSFNPHTLMGK